MEAIKHIVSMGVGWFRGLARCTRTKTRSMIPISILLLVSVVHLYSLRVFVVEESYYPGNLTVPVTGSDTPQTTPVIVPSIPETVVASKSRGIGPGNVSTERSLDNSFEIFKRRWIRQDLSKNITVYLYSAYQDTRGSVAYVRVLGLALNRFRHQLDCQLVDANGYTVTSQAKLGQNHEHFNLPWSSFFFNCPLPTKYFRPVEVGIVLHGNEPGNLTKWLPVTRNERENRVGTAVHRTEKRMAVCVKPLHYSYNRAVWFIEFIEFYKILGVSHFFLYNNTVGPEMEAVLRHYQEEGIVTIQSWVLPIKTLIKIRNQAQFTALNDCNYQAMYQYEYVAMVDLDEYLIPRKDPDLLSLLHKIDEPSRGSFVFSNVFFYLYFDNDTSVSPNGNFSESPYLVTMYKTKRKSEIYKHGQRSKYIAKPHSVVEVGNHVVWEHTKGSKSYKVLSTEGLSHHYRICEFGGFDCLKMSSMIDNTALKWSTQLFPSVGETCSTVFPHLGKCPPAPPLGSPW